MMMMMMSRSQKLKMSLSLSSLVNDNHIGLYSDIILVMFEHSNKNYH